MKGKKVYDFWELSCPLTDQELQEAIDAVVEKLEGNSDVSDDESEDLLVTEFETAGWIHNDLSENQEVIEDDDEENNVDYENDMENGQENNVSNVEEVGEQDFVSKNKKIRRTREKWRMKEFQQFRNRYSNLAERHLREKTTSLGASREMTTEDNGNIGLHKPTSSSNEDLSEYTDADESISAPTEFLAEFLSAVMLKDYETALKYCKLILQYEPNNITAKDFYPLILEKVKQMKTDEENSNESEEEDNEENTSSSSNSASENTTSEESSEEQEEEEEGVENEQVGGDKHSKGSSDGDGTTGSYSSLEDDEVEIDQLTALAAKYQIDNMDLGNGNKIYSTAIKPTHMIEPKMAAITTNATLENQLPFGTSSDSESPTEPVSQQTIAMLRAKVVPNKI
ncbi:hypothetical protein MML48_7g00012147 [Holotrichia oblita]|uniref:Uncharacterized protein n=1 Tax=Holotrichia oblita TaxID=644536 RepID=A0ACB9SQP5_HOLOL|nr:hypothetical protein MML48_7g00012147 [Holotrichia oblita]